MSSKPHNNKPRALSSQEKQYALRQLREVRSGMKYVSVPFLFMAVMGFVMLFWFAEYDALPGIGALLLGVGLAGFIGFSLYSSDMRFQVEADSQWRRGRLSVQLVSHGIRGTLWSFVDELKLYVPSGLDGYVQEICGRYGEQKMAVEMAVVRYTRKQETQFFHVPLRIGDDLCVSRALRTHGLRFALLPSLLVYARLLLGVVMAGVLAVGGHGAISALHLPGRGLVDMLLVVWMIAAVVLGFWLGARLMPDEARIIERRVRCGPADDMRE